MDRRVFFLSVYQAVVGITIAVHLMAASLVSHNILEIKALATLPVFLHSFTTALVSVPASWWMARYGRIAGFSLGAACGVCGTALAAWGVHNASFPTLCAGSVLIGAYNGVGHFYRFAAVEVTAASLRSRALSLTVAGGVLAGIVGPALAKWTKGTFDAPFAGSYLALAVLIAVTALSLLLFDIPKPPVQRFLGGRPLSRMLRYPLLPVALIGGALGYVVMSLLMVAAPLAMDSHHHAFDTSVIAMQGHFIAMYAPSFGTGSLIARVGALRVMTWGIVLELASIVVALAAGEGVHFIVSLFLLGLGWNFLFVGANVLLTSTYLEEEKAKAQALFNLTTYSMVCVAALASGVLHESVGWMAVSFVALGVLLVVAVLVAWCRARDIPPLSEFIASRGD